MQHVSRIETPVGELWIAHDSLGHLALAVYGPELDRRPFAERLHQCGEACSPHSVAGRRTTERLVRYFDGDMEALELDAWPFGTPFQLAVWRALRAIPAGCTATYGAVAERIRRPTAVRAVGAANAANPLSIFIPCHRLVGAGGSLRGYAGGLPAKRWLLRHEGVEGMEEPPPDQPSGGPEPAGMPQAPSA